MFGYRSRLDALDKTVQLRQMHFVEQARRAQPEPNAVQADRQIAAHSVEYVQVEDTVAEVVFAMNLDSVNRQIGLE